MKEYKIEVMSHGACVDRERDKIYQIDTYTLKLDHEALSDYVTNKPRSTGSWEWDFETEAAYIADREAKAEKFAQWQKDIFRAVGLPFDPSRCVIEQVLAEFFAVVNIAKIN